jgi:Domain of unknown function (DUF4145)
MQCPHCLQHFHDDWKTTLVAEDCRGTWCVGSTQCPACKRLVANFGVRGTNGWLIYPRAISRAPLPSEVAADFAVDYAEACLVLADSEKASAALSRRCLQHLLRGKAGIKEGNLASEIQQVLDSRQLPTHLAEDLDAIRNIGNFAAHPIKTTHSGEIVEVEPQEAEWLLNLLEQLFDFYFVQPARAQAKRDALNAKLQATGKPRMKSP